MGKKPFILAALGLFLIIGAFTFGVSDPSCGRRNTMSPGDVCVNESTGKKQSYDEAKAEQNREIRIGLPIVGGIMILVGGYTAVKRRRNPNWRAEATAKQQATGNRTGQQPQAWPGQPQQPGAVPPAPGQPGTFPPQPVGGAISPPSATTPPVPGPGVPPPPGNQPNLPPVDPTAPPR